VSSGLLEFARVADFEIRLTLDVFFEHVTRDDLEDLELAEVSQARAHATKKPLRTEKKGLPVAPSSSGATAFSGRPSPSSARPRPVSEYATKFPVRPRCRP
jgi:hypothetical protein